MNEFLNKSFVSIYISLAVLISTINCNINRANTTSSLKNETGVNSNTNLQGKTVPFVINSNSDSIYKYTVNLPNNNYSLRIETRCVHDAVIEEESHQFNPIVLNQTMLFMYKDSVLKRVEHQVKKITQKSQSKKNVEMLENVIRDIGVINGKDGSFYYIEGNGGCNSCSEYFGFYSAHGDLLWDVYSSRRDNFNYEKGEYKKTIEQYGVPDSLFKPNNLRLIWVYPPQLKEQESKSSLIKIE